MVSDFDTTGLTEAKEAVEVLRSKPWIDTPPADPLGDVLRDQVRLGNEYHRLLVESVQQRKGETDGHS
jgi:hypothetical protein